MAAMTSPSLDWAALVTVVVTTSPSPVHPSTELLRATLASVRDHAPMLSRCRTVVVCAGVRGMRAQSKLRSGRVTHEALRSYGEYKEALRALCAQFPPEYHRNFGEDETYPEEFVDALTREGWLAAMIPEEYGGSGLGLTEASIIMEEVNRCGGNAGHCHGQMYNMGTLLRHGSDVQKQQYLPGIASGELRLPARPRSARGRQGASRQGARDGGRADGR